MVFRQTVEISFLAPVTVVLNSMTNIRNGQKQQNTNTEEYFKRVLFFYCFKTKKRDLKEHLFYNKLIPHTGNDGITLYRPITAVN